MDKLAKEFREEVESRQFSKTVVDGLLQLNKLVGISLIAVILLSYWCYKQQQQINKLEVQINTIIEVVKEFKNVQKRRTLN